MSLNNPAFSSIKPDIDAVTGSVSGTVGLVTDTIGRAVKNVATRAVNRGARFASDSVARGASVVGLNLLNSSEATAQLTNFANIMRTDEARAAAEDIGKSAGEIGLVIASELEPLAKPIIDRGIAVVETGAKKAIGSMANTGKYAVSSFLGPLATVPMAVASVVDTAVSVADTGSKLTTTVSDTVNAAIDISDKIFKEQQETIDRISQTTDTFLAHQANVAHQAASATAAAASATANAASATANATADATASVASSVAAIPPAPSVTTPSLTYAAKAKAAQLGGVRTRSCLRRHHPKKHSTPSSTREARSNGSYTRKILRFNKFVEENSVFI